MAGYTFIMTTNLCSSLSGVFAKQKLNSMVGCCWCCSFYRDCNDGDGGGDGDGDGDGDDGGGGCGAEGHPLPPPPPKQTKNTKTDQSFPCRSSQ